MSLITPLFLLGLLGIAFPWWLHRLEMQTTEREKFATTRFLEASKKRIHVQRKLKYLLLMALRMAFLALLAFAFARPILFDDPQIVASDDNVHHVIVVDTSFSMHEGARLQQARTLAETILDNMDSGDVASLFAASTRITTLSEATDSADEVREQLPALIADNGRLDIGAMIASLNGLLEDSQAAVLLHVISDFQLSGQAVRFADMIPDVINGRPVTLDVQSVVNAATPNAMVESVIIENRNSVSAAVRSFNGELTTGEKQVHLSINGVEQQMLELPATSNGSALVQFNDVVFGEGDNRVDINLTSTDTLADDDIRYTVFDNSPPAPVLLLTPDTSSLGITYLSAALATAPRRYAVEPNAVEDFDPRVLQRYPWLIVEDLGAVNPTLAAALADYVRGGGSVFAALGPRSGSLTSVPVLDIAISAPLPGRDTVPAAISRIDTSHPALNKSSGWNNVNVHAMKVVPTGDDNILISQGNDTPVLIERNIGAGRFVLYASSLDNSTSDLPVKPVFVSFMAEVAQYLSNEKLLVKAQTADSYLQLIQSGSGSGQVVDPTGKNLLSLQDTTLAQDVLLNLTGYYQVFTAGGEVLVAVNPDSRESDLALMTTETLQNWQASVAGASGNGSTVATDVELAAARTDAGDEIEIWRFFLLLMALLVLAESLLGNRYLNLKTGTY
jgi:hypothetical protein